jgi:hypothetical protein
MKCLLGVVAALILCEGCGNNLAGPAGSSLLRPPGNFAAFSIDSAHVSLSWTAPAAAAETTFTGYAVYWGSVSDTLPRSALQFTAGPLSRGATTFSIRALQKGESPSDPASITWAPAWRFDAVPITLSEYNSAQPGSTPPGLDVGTATTNPSALGFGDAGADSALDFYVYGPGGSPLQLLSASVYNPGWHQTFISTVTTSSLDLNAPISAFPGDNTFTDQTVTLSDNMIYYVKTTGNAGEIYYARIHVHLLAGSFPNRAIEVRISLQRVSRLPYA